jgi:hypothetical protein
MFFMACPITSLLRKILLSIGFSLYCKISKCYKWPATWANQYHNSLIRVPASYAYSHFAIWPWLMCCLGSVCTLARVVIPLKGQCCFLTDPCNFIIHIYPLSNRLKGANEKCCCISKLTEQRGIVTEVGITYLLHLLTG